MKGKLLKSLYSSLAVMATCASMLVAATWEVFSTDNQEVNNHLQAGNMGVTLEMVMDDGTTIDLTEDGRQIFNMVDMLPGDTSTATIVVGNSGKAPFVFDVKIINVNLGTDDTDASTALMEQVEIAFYEEDGVTLIKSFMLDEAEDPTNVVGFDPLQKAQSKTIVIKATFTENVDNNSAQDGDVSFDLQVAATQYAG